MLLSSHLRERSSAKRWIFDHRTVWILPDKKKCLWRGPLPEHCLER